MSGFTQREIKSSFYKLLQKKPIAKISVKDIVEDCGINRNSFYYHFRDIPSLLEEIIEDQVTAFEHTHTEIHSLSECFDLCIQILKEHQKEISYISHTDNDDVLKKYLSRICECATAAYINTAVMQTPVSEQDKQLFIHFISKMLYSSIFDWIGQGMQEGALQDLNRWISLCRNIPERMLREANS